MAILTITANAASRLQYWGSSIQSYATVHDAASATLFGSALDDEEEIGQLYLSGTTTYRLFRYGLQFDCSDLPATSTISAAKVQLYVKNDNSATDFDITIVSGTDLAFPAVAADYGDLLDDTTSFGTWNTSGFTSAGYVDVDLNATGISAITKAGTTKFGARSSRDISSSAPTGLEWIEIGDAFASNNAKLVITYTYPPTVTTQTMQAITGTTATGRGTITELGGGSITAHGHCWDTSTDPTTSDSVVDNGAVTATGGFTSALTGLSSGTSYYVRAYATNPAGTSYGANAFFTANAPMVITQTCEEVKGETAIGRGNIVFLNGTVSAHGHCWDTSVDPTTSDSSVDNGATSSTGTFSSAITGLTPGTAYYTRAFATNENGTGYGDNVYFVPPKTGPLGRAGYTWDESSNLRSFDENAIERQYIHTDDVDNTPVDDATTDPISSDWAYEHVAAADPHIGYVLESLFDAHSVIYSVSDNTPVQLTIGEQTLLGRLTSANITAVSIGIADNNILQVDHASPADDDYAKFTTAGLEGRSYAELRADINMDALNEPTGFPNRTDSTLSLSTRTFTIAPSNGSFTYYIAGVEYTVSSSDDITISTASGLHVLYYDGATLSEVVNPSHAAFDDVIVNKAFVALIYWNNTNTTSYVHADERHGVIMSGETHHWLHDQIRSRWNTGLTASGYTLSTKSDAALKFDVSDGDIYDEDVKVEIENGTASNQYEQVLQGDAVIPVLYRDGDPGYWKEQAASTLPYINAGDNQNLAYNSVAGSTWGQTACSNTKFVVYTLIATNDWLYPIKMVQGNAQYDSKNDALEGAMTEITAWGTMPAAEFVILYRFVMQTGVYAGVKNAQIIEVTDYRAAQITGVSATAQDHGTLAGLADDDHAQYLLADGTRALSGAWSMGSQATTNVNIDSGTIGGITLDGAIAGGDQSFTGVGDMTFTSGSILKSGSTNTNTLLLAANDTTFITLTTGATDTLDIGAHSISGKLTAGATEIEGSAFDINGGDISSATISGGLTWSAAQNLGSQNLTNVNIDSGTIGGVTLDGAIAGGDQAFTGVGDMTFTSGSILAAVDGAGTTLLLKAGGLTGTTFITLTSQSGGTDTMALATFAMGGAAITGHAQAISDNALVTIDGADIASGEFARFTANGLLSRTPQEVADEIDSLIKLDDLGTPDDNTDLDATTSEHGLVPKLDNVATNFLNGQGGWSAPAGSGASSEEALAYALSS